MHEQDVLTSGPAVNLSRFASIAFAVHLLLLFLPPIPPLHKGSLWSFLLAYAAITLALCDPGLSGTRRGVWWVRRPQQVRADLALAGIAAVGGLGFALREFAPPAFVRFSREDGVWEPLTLFAFLLSARLLLFAAARSADDGKQRHLRLLAAGFAVLALEEVDYFGIFGGLFGRIEGTYVGGLHDGIRLYAKGLLPAPAIAIVVGAVGTLAWLLHRGGYLQPRRLLAMIASRQGIWLGAGFGLLSAAAIQEAARVRPFASPSPEELFELMGALGLLAFAREACFAAMGEWPDRGSALAPELPRFAHTTKLPASHSFGHDLLCSGSGDTRRNEDALSSARERVAPRR